MFTKTPRRISQLGLVLLLSFGLLMGLSALLNNGGVQTAVAAPNAILAVTIGDSSFADDGQCSLREAIVNANRDTQAFISAGECPAGSGDDSITLGIDVTLTSIDNSADGNGDNGLPVITSTITISGAGYTLSRDGASPSFRFFYLNQSSSILTLQNITVTNGNGDTGWGGALRASTGQIMIEAATFSNNQAANGGSIYRSGNSILKINNSRFLANQATSGSGGAINLGCCTSGTRTILNSLFDGNSATNQGGAISVNSGGNSNIANSTFINNSALRGGAVSITLQRPANLYNVTIISNTATVEGGGVYIFGGGSAPDLYNTLISGNYAPANADCSGSGLSNVDAKNNLFGANGNNGGCTGFTPPSSNNITAIDGLDTIVESDGNGLALLADNGGKTETIALLATGLAANSGDNALLPNESTLGIDGDGDGNTDDPIDYDQRLYSRPYGNTADIGAFEAEDVMLHARDDWYTALETMTLMITETQGVLVNDINDITGTLTAVLSTTTANGTLDLAATGAFTYTPDLDVCGDSFTYYANNGLFDSNVATVNINVTGCAVTAVDDVYTTTEDVPLTVPPVGVLDNDINSFYAYAYLRAQPASGNVVLAENGGFTYTPALNFSGVETFTYYAVGELPAPVAYWPFDDGANPTNDATGLGFDATINNGVTFTTEVPAALGSGMALNFDNANGEVYSGGDPEALELQTFTAAFWVNIDTMGFYNDFMSNGTAWGVEQYQTSGRISFFTFGSSNYRLTGNTNINDGQWHHVAVVYSGASKMIYIDGSLDVSVAATGFINYSNFQGIVIGEAGFNGRLDDVRLYQNGLSPSEIQAAMAGDTPNIVDSATVTMTVTAVNDAPVANDDWYEAGIDQPLTVPAIGVLENDVDGDSLLTAMVDTPPAVGSLILNLDGGFTYTPQPSFTGPISYTYIASDGFLTDTATVTMVFSANQCYTYLDSSGQTYSNPSGYAIELALADAQDGDLIKIAGNCINPLGGDGNGRSIDIAQNITLQGGYTNTNWLAASDPILYPTTIDGNNESIVLSIANSTVTLDGLIITGGFAAYAAAVNDGGGLYIVDNSNVTILNSLITDNIADDDGGGLYINGGSVVTIENSQILSNTSDDEGGGIHVFDGIVTITDSAINGNYADDDGAGLDIEANGVVTVTRTIINNNVADDDAGGIESAGNLWLLDSTVNGNISDDRAAIDGDGGIIIIDNTVISGNVTFDSGGSIDNDDIMYISNSLIQNNRVLDDDGGAIDNDGMLIITDTQIIGNYAADDCGGIYNSDTMTLTRVTIEGNRADYGGGICVYSSNSTKINESRIANNIASVNGGGFYLGGSSSLILTNSTVYSNMAVQAGGIYNDGGSAAIINSTISGNSAQQDSAIVQSGTTIPTMLLQHTTLVSNTASITDTAMGIYTGTLTISNSIIANNPASNCAFSGGVLVSGGYNMENGISCGLSATGDQSGTYPLLEPLADNGGATQTHAPMLGSPVIDAIPVGFCTVATDQRGMIRPFGVACDIGAMEFGFTLYMPIIMK